MGVKNILAAKGSFVNFYVILSPLSEVKYLFHNRHNLRPQCFQHRHQLFADPFPAHDEGHSRGAADGGGGQDPSGGLVHGEGDFPGKGGGPGGQDRLRPAQGQDLFPALPPGDGLQGGAEGGKVLPESFRAEEEESSN